MRNVPIQAIQLVQKFEGCRLNRYKTIDGLKTIGYGHVLPKDSDIGSITGEEALQYLNNDLQIAAKAVLRLTKVALTDNEFSALISFVFNLGAGSYQASQLRMQINRGDYVDADKQFIRWCFCNGIEYSGLKRRRQAEADLFKS